MILSKILSEVRLAVEERKRAIPLEELKKTPPQSNRGFKEQIKKKEGLALIAEIKKASPSAGVIIEDFAPARIAASYSACGASAISVLTERKFFLGSRDYLREVKQATTLPILEKDFIIDPYQIYEAALDGADALLLIADILSEDKLREYIATCKSLGIEPLVEVHSEPDVDKALACGAEVVGINNRDLRNFEVDISTTEKLIKFIPKDKVIVSESGIKSHDDICYLKGLGVDAVLIGETLLRSRNIGAKVREIMGW